MDGRGSGILLHITSLPSRFGIGDLGPWAYRFADFLAQSGQSYWQLLPLNPTDPMSGNCPYSSMSALAGNSLLISPDLLVKWGLLTASDLKDLPPFPAHWCDYLGVISFKGRLLNLAYERLGAHVSERKRFEAFCEENKGWLEDYGLFVVIKDLAKGKAWVEWEEGLRQRDPVYLARVSAQFAKKLEQEKFYQYLFFRQWMDLRRYCNERGIRLIGDIPIYVNHDSVDVWTHPEIFNLDEGGRPLYVGGVPPDYFSRTGQRWGNPTYQWDVLRETGYAWWIERFSHNLRLFDLVRVDHFRGFAGFWEIPAQEETAVNGRWVEAPAQDFFSTLLRDLRSDFLIAEDLGVITPDVVQVMTRFGFPGMRVMVFAFDDDSPAQAFLPHNYVPNTIVYTGTHDNNTVRGWFENEAIPETRARLLRYLGRDVREVEIHEELIRLAMMSVAKTAIFPIQDLLGLGRDARMNIPSTTQGNWEWRLTPHQLRSALAEHLRELTWTYGRASDYFCAHREAWVGGLKWLDRAPLEELGAGFRGRPWPPAPVIYEINAWVWLKELSQRHGKRIELGSVPPAEWDAIASLGLDAVWLMGVWERSPTGRRMAQEDPGLHEEFGRILPDLCVDDIVGSPYCVHGYVADGHLGGPDGLAAAREMLSRRGIRLMLDHVPNHLAPDHPWVSEHPEYFIQGDQEDLKRTPDGFFWSGGRILARGRDPFFPPWKDTAQVNAFVPELRRAVAEALRSVAEQCDGIRCDMAMLLTNRVFEMTWGKRAGDVPGTEFWSDVIGAVRQSHPYTLFLAEVYWGLEGELLQLGFDCCYDKGLYDKLVQGPAGAIRHHLSTPPGFQDRLLRFLENHDEPRAATALYPERHRAAAVAFATLPGAKLLHEGQMEGRRIKLPVQLGRRPAEPVDRELRALYRSLLKALWTGVCRTGEWTLCECGGWADNTSYINLLAWCWQGAEERCLVVINYADLRSQGRVRLPWDDLSGRTWKLTDLLTARTFEREGGEMRDPGLYVDLGAWGFHILRLWI